MQGFWKNFIRIIVIFLIFLTIIMINFTDREKRRFFRFPGRILSIAVSLFGGLVYETKNLWKRYVHLTGVEKENEKLKREILKKELEISILKEKLKTMERLEGLLGYREVFHYSTLVGNVIGYSSDGISRGILINAGSNLELKEGMPVVSSEGLIGIVAHVHPLSSNVVLITDKNLSVDVINMRTSEKAILTGDGNVCRLKYYPKTGDVMIGDVFQTAGISETFPRGISVGSVIEVQEKDEGLFKEVKIKPFVDPKKINEVLIIMKK